MERACFEAYIRSQWGVQPDHPFSGDEDSTVYRHPGNRKWFALVMRIRKDRLIPGAEGMADVVNLKIAPFLSGSFRRESGVFPAYHMNKEQWVSVLLDDSTDAEQTKALLEMSYSLTAPKLKKPGIGRRQER